MKNISTISIDAKLATELKNHGEIHTYTTTSDLFYKNQIPIVAYLIISGNAYISKNKKIVASVEKNTLIGLKELLNNEATTYSATVLPETKVCFLSLSCIYEIIKDNNILKEKIDTLVL